MKKTILAISFFLLAWAAPLPAEVITYQGRLKESNLPVNASRAFLFEFCDDEFAGACTPSPSGSQSFAVQNGLFKSTFTAPSVNLASGQWYLKVSVEGTALTPRERLTAVPYSVYASSAGYSAAAVQKTGDSMSGQLTLSGSTLTVTGSEFSVGGSTFVVKNGYVGIGTATPGQPLHVVTDGQYVFAANAGAASATINLVHAPGGAARINDNSGGGMIALSVSNSDKLVVNEAGNVGLSSATPAYRLVVSSGAGEAGNMVVISTGDSSVIRMTGAGQVYASSFYGDGSGLTGVAAATGVDSTKLPLAGGTLTGNLLIDNSTLSVTGGGLSVSSAGAANLELVTDIGGGHVRTQTGHPLYLGTSGSDSMVVNVAGDVGINNNAPMYRLDVGGAAAFTGQVIVGSSLSVHGNAFSVSGSTLVVADGKVGIGAENPQAKLHISSGGMIIDGDVAGVMLQVKAPPSGTATRISLDGSDSNSFQAYELKQPSRTWWIAQNLGNFGDGRLQIFDATASNYRAVFFASGDIGLGGADAQTAPVMMINPAGLVGIGAISPGSALDVRTPAATEMAQIWRDSAGTVVSSVSAAGILQAMRFVGDGSGLINVAATTGVDASKVAKAGDTMTGQLTLAASTLTVTGGKMSVSGLGTDLELMSDVGGGHVYTIGGQYLYLGTGGTNRLLIDPTGNVAINKTPANYRLDVGGAANFDGQVIAAGTMTVAGDAFSVGASTLVVQGGRVGIGTMAPQAGLDVLAPAAQSVALFRSPGAASVSLQSDDSATQRVSLGFNSWSVSQSGLRHMADINAESGGHLTFFTTNDGATAGFERLRITSDGLISAGVGSPAARLDLLGTGTTPSDMVQIWRDSAGTVVSSVSATGVVMASKFIGNGSGLSGISADLNSPIGTLAVADGGTGAAGAAAALANLGGLPLAGGTMTGQLILDGTIAEPAFRVGGSTFVVYNSMVGINTAAPAQALDIGAGNIRIVPGQQLQWGSAGLAISGSGTGISFTEGLSPRLNIGSTGGFTTVAAGDISGVTIDTTSAVHVVAKNSPAADGRVAVFGDLRSNGSVAGQYLAGGNFEATIEGADSAELAAGLRTVIRHENAGAGTVNNAYGLMVDNLQNQAGTIANTYGVYIGTQTAGTQTNVPYSLYAADRWARSYFGGSVGIGTESPQDSLHIVSTNPWIRMNDLDGSKGISIGMDGNKLRFDESNVGSRMVLDLDTSRLGIGTLSPGYTLDVQGGYVNTSAGFCLGGSCISSWNSVTGAWNRSGVVVSPATPSDNVLIQSTLTVAGNAFSVGGAVLAVAGGKVGIGNGAPAAELDVSGDINASGSLTVGGNLLTAGMIKSSVSSFHFYDPNNFDRFSFSSGATALYDQLNQQTLTVANGQVGIGTASPAYALHISSAAAAGWLPDVMIESTASGTPQLILQAGGHQGRIATSGSNGGTYIGSMTNDFVSFHTNGVEAIRLATNGKVGLGTASPAEALDVAGRVQISTFAGGNAVTDGLISMGTGGMLFQSGGNTYMRVANGGNYVGIGNSVYSNTNSPRLQVLGSLSVGSTYNAAQPLPNSLVVENRVGIGVTSPSAALDVRDATGVNPYLLVLGTGTAGSFISVSTSGVMGVGYGTPSTQTVLHAQAVARNTTGGEDVTLGLVGSVSVAGTGSEDAAAGADLYARADGAQNIGYLVGVHTSVERTSAGAGAVGKAIGLYVEDLHNGAGPGAITDTYGVYIGTQTEGAQTNAPYSIYAVDQNARAYFAGKMGLGTASPRYALEISSAPGSSDQMLVVSTGTDIVFGVKGNGEVYGAKFIGDGSGLTNVAATNAVLRAGDIMSGSLGIYSNTSSFPRDLETNGIVISTAGSIQTTGVGNGSISGSARGNGAVDLQTVRTAVGQVASGHYAAIGGGSNNSATANFSVVAGGTGNSATTIYAAVLGGINNVASGGYSTVGGGNANLSSNGWTTVAGGISNTASQNNASVGGGENNVASGLSATVSGGSTNKALGALAAVGGGAYNVVSGSNSVISGGMYNAVAGTSAVIVGGESNKAPAMWSSISGGRNNYAGGTASFVGSGESNQAPGNYSAIAGGFNNSTDWGQYAFIGGGSGNIVSSETAAMGGGYQNVLKGQYSFIGAGSGNQNHGYASAIAGGIANVISPSAFYSSIGGGDTNTIAPSYGGIFSGQANSLLSGDNSVVGGGYDNVISAGYSVISGGSGNRVYGDRGTIGGGGSNRAGVAGVKFYATVGGGNSNAATGEASVVAGGTGNTASGQYATVPGGIANSASGDYAFAAGRASSSAAAGTFTWADSVGDTVVNGLLDQVVFKAKGGFWVSTGTIHATPGLFVNTNNQVGIGTDAPVKALHIKNQGVVPDIRLERGLGSETWDIGGNSGIYFNVAFGGANRLTITDTGFVGVGLTPGANPAKLQVAGDVGLGDGTALGNSPVVVWLTAASAVAAGDIVTITGSNMFNTTTTASDPAVIGVALNATAAATVGKVAVAGVALVNCSGPIAGQHAITSGTAGQASGVNFPTSGTSAGIFLTNCGTPSAGKALLLLK